MKILKLPALLLLICLLSVNIFYGQAEHISPLEGRWNLIIDHKDGEMPSWLEIRHSGNRTLVGRVVVITGSARPISEVKYKGNSFNFSIPVQWEPGNNDLSFEGNLSGDVLKGSMTYYDGKTYSWTGSRAPELPYVKFPEWGEEIALFNGTDLSGWKTDGKNMWVVENGILKSPGDNGNLISDQKFTNFKLHAEFRYPKGSNSGIYLRGRYEVQITDSYGRSPMDVEFGGIYGFLTPSVMAAGKAGEWQSYDIILNGRRVTVIANGVPLIMDQVIPGMTGGALDNLEAEPGSFMIQGDHGPIEFRSFRVIPLLNE